MPKEHRDERTKGVAEAAVGGSTTPQHIQSKNRGSPWRETEARTSSVG